MREIKFRAYHKGLKEMFKAFDIWKLDSGIKRMFSKEDVELMQFTGLRDKNGKDIYEGDIIKNHQAEVNIVKFEYGSWGYENYHAGHLPLWRDAESSEILGNRFENPELLGEK